MKSIYLLSYIDDETQPQKKLFSTNFSKLNYKLKQWEEQGMSTRYDRITEIYYDNLEDLLQKINSINGTQ